MGTPLHVSMLSSLARVNDFLAVLLGGWLAYHLRSQFNFLENASQYHLMLLVAGLLQIVLFPTLGVYRPRSYSMGELSRRLIWAWSLVAGLLLVLVFAAKVGYDFSRIWFFLWFFTSLIALLLGRFSIVWLASRFRTEQRVVIIGAGELGKTLAKRVQEEHWLGFQIVAFLDDDTSLIGTRIQEIPVVDSVRAVEHFVQESAIEEVWIALPLRADHRVRETLHQLRHTTVNIRFVPDIFSFRLINHSMTEIAGIPVLNLTESPMFGMNRFVKRVEDIILSTLILLLVSPFLLMIALAVKWSSPGPVFYRQTRVGWNGREFQMLKFRSMLVDVEKDGVCWGNASKKQVTPVGAWIRRSSLDELPQFFNVLLGEMSIVGPRPERPMWVEKFKDEIPDYMKKHLVKAGITGWAQINGWRGDTDLTKRIEYDLYYIEHWSFGLDLKIIFLTLQNGLAHKHSG